MRILLIEDNPGDAFLIKFYLEESVFKDAELIHAEFLKSGLDLLSKNSFNIILLDLNLPDSNGIHTLKEVLAAANNTIVIVLTGLNDEELGIETVKLGAQDFLIKGQFDGKVLASSVRYAYERSQLQKQVDSCAGQLDKYQQQFNLAQQLNAFGYWELNISDHNMLWSDNLTTLLNSNGLNHSFKNLLSLVSENETIELENKFKNAVETGGEFELKFALKTPPKSGSNQFICKGKALLKANEIVSQLVGTIQHV